MSDKITPEQLRKEAVAVERMHGETLTVDWRTKQANQLRAHAAALEELAALREQLAEARAEIAALKGHAVEPRIGLNSDGSLDEVVGSPGHIEKLELRSLVRRGPIK